MFKVYFTSLSTPLLYTEVWKQSEISAKLHVEQYESWVKR